MLSKDIFFTFQNSGSAPEEVLLQRGDIKSHEDWTPHQYSQISHPRETLYGGHYSCVPRPWTLQVSHSPPHANKESDFLKNMFGIAQR